ncbi:sulfatase [Lentisphaera marina]|uniref:sulfatase n=1 Tax=Lentisphaera marina TaxID=1111041 RepID=UPI00236648E7|nr:sulfatase [Lentisphaera marina]MDD7985052.1 sulfatase [Lentisphaera marina]
MIKKYCFLLSFFTVGLVAAADKPMNVVFILADDLGWSDTELYGQTKLYKTPNIMRLAKRGCTFTRAYSNSPLCSPTRASFLTGQTPARHGSTQPRHHTKTVALKAELAKRARPSEKAISVSSATRLDTNYPTIGKMMKQGGYETGHFGKWHLGPKPYSPLQHGFDVDVPHHTGAGPGRSYVAPWSQKNIQPNYEKEHIEDRMVEECLKWVDSLSGDKPFFMNYWMFSVHGPFDAKQELIDKYEKLIDPNSKQRSALYAAMVQSLDDAVGALLDGLESRGLMDNTVIIFTSDNGGNMYSQLDQDIVPTSNFPLRGGKASMCEGGVRVPCTVVWPGVTKAASQSEEIIQSSDFYTTILKGMNISMPDNHDVDGIDIRPALEGGELDREAIFTYFPCIVPVPEWLPPSMSVHSGKWKLVRVFFGGENGEHDYKLYDLSNDIAEENNLADSNPELLKRLDNLIEAYLTEANGVTPVRNPDFDLKQFDPSVIGKRPESKKKNKKSQGKKPKSSGRKDPKKAPVAT